MEKFTHGIMVVDPENPDDIGSDNTTVIHFVGYWQEPPDWDAEASRLREELLMAVIFWEKHSEIYESLEKTLNDRFILR
jgi:hypothetical protein